MISVSQFISYVHFYVVLLFDDFIIFMPRKLFTFLIRSDIAETTIQKMCN